MAGERPAVEARAPVLHSISVGRIGPILGGTAL